MAALVATVLAQVLKLVIVLLTERRLLLSRLLETGGMPSSHSAAVAALAVALGMAHGWGSPQFAIAAVFGSIVMYDATGIRRRSEERRVGKEGGCQRSTPHDNQPATS